MLKSKGEARKELQRMLATLRADLRDIESFAVDNKLEFDFMGMKFLLKDPGGDNRYASKGFFISEGEWNSSGWGCEGGDTWEKYETWVEKHFPYKESNDE